MQIMQFMQFIRQMSSPNDLRKRDSSALTELIAHYEFILIQRHIDLD
jgi:hypothetical protein